MRFLVVASLLVGCSARVAPGSAAMVHCPPTNQHDVEPNEPLEGVLVAGAYRLPPFTPLVIAYKGVVVGEVGLVGANGSFSRSYAIPVALWDPAHRQLDLTAEGVGTWTEEIPPHRASFAEWDRNDPDEGYVEVSVHDGALRYEIRFRGHVAAEHGTSTSDVVGATLVNLSEPALSTVLQLADEDFSGSVPGRSPQRATLVIHHADGSVGGCVPVECRPCPEVCPPSTTTTRTWTDEPDEPRPNEPVQPEPDNPGQPADEPS